MSDRQRSFGSDRFTLCNLNPIGTPALTRSAQTPVIGLAAARVVNLYANFVYGTTGITADAYIQTSMDGGTSWFDIANFHFTTSSAAKISSITNEPATPLTAGTAPGSGTLAANTVLNGIIGDRLRALVTTTGAYTDGVLSVYGVSKT